MNREAIQDAAERIIEPNWKNKTLFLGDNLHIMRRMNSSLMDLIYADPPFNTGRKFRAPIGADKEITEVFSDIWREQDLDQLEHALLAQYTNEMDDLSLFSKSRYEGFNPLYSAITSSRATHGKGMFTYLIMMSMRLIEMRRLLKETGSIFLHCDHTAGHYLKMVMDAIFGKENFRNEILWQRAYVKGTKKGPRKTLGTITESILFYAKSEKTRIVIPKTIPKELPKFKHQDERGYYRAVTQLMADSKLIGRGTPYEWRGLNPKYGWRVSKENLESMHKEGLIHYNSSGRPYRKQYAAEYEGKDVGNLWCDIPPESPEERTDYSTQKPLKLYERIIKASSNPGDRVFDPFCGCTTTLVAAEKLGREWVGIDLAARAEAEIKKRMMKLAIDRGENELAIWNGIHIRELQKSVASLWRDELGKLPHPRTHKKWLYGEQRGHCGGCGQHFEDRHLEVDHYVPKSKGGTDHRSNLQLLCGACNSMKGDRPQAYLEKQLKRLGIILD